MEATTARAARLVAAATLSAAALTGCTVTLAEPSAPIGATVTPVEQDSATALPTPDETATISLVPGAEPTPATTPSATETPTSSPPPPVEALLAPGASGDEVRELQARLMQLDWFSGEVTGRYGEETTAAVRGYQDKRELPATGTVDRTTWDSLLTRTRAPSDDEMHNRLTAGPSLLADGASGAGVRELQARLKQIGWFSGNVTDYYGPQTVAAVRGFQGKRGIPVTGEVDQRTLDRLHAMTRPPTAAELTNASATQPAAPVAALDPRCLTGRVLCISKASRSLVWVVDGTPQARFDVRFGSESDPTREGTFSVYRKNREWTSTIYGSAMPYSMFFSGGQAVHYSSDFAARGYAGASHGCVNVRDLDGLAHLFDRVSIGDKVVVYR